MRNSLSEFSRWALSDDRTIDERHLIFLVCIACRLRHWQRLSPELQRKCLPPQIPLDYLRELYLNPLLAPSLTAEDTELAAETAPYLRAFDGSPGYQRRRIGDAAKVLSFFPALEEVTLDGDFSDISFVGSLPNLRKLALQSALMEDLEPLRHCPTLRHLSLHFVSTAFPSLTPSLYWVDATPLQSLQQLESLSVSPNAAILRGLSFPHLRSASFSTTSTIQPDCTHLPDMPELRVLKIDGLQSLRGIERFPNLVNLEISGPLRDFDALPALERLTCLKVHSMHGWPRDVAPLAKLPQLLWVGFPGEMPRNYWPLTGAPRLCELAANGASSVKLDVQAINAVLRPWDEVFRLETPRQLPPWRFVAVAAGGDSSVLPKGTDAPGDDYLADPKLFHLELLWMYQTLHRVLADFEEEVEPRGWSAPSESNWERRVSLEIQTIAGARRLPEIVEALRQAMAWSPHDWRFQLSVNLRISKLQMTAQQRKWLAEIEAQSRRWDDEQDRERWALTKQHLIDTQFRLQQSKQDGVEPNPEDFIPPDEIRPPSDATPAGGAADTDDDDDDDESTDFELKPFDEQDRSDDDDDADDGNHVKTAPPPEPPASFMDDPYGHPLADSYRFYATLTFDTLYFHGPNLATLIQLLGREPDVYYPPRPKPD